MIAPTAIPENAQSLSGPDGERVKERLGKLLPSPITDRNKEALQMIAAGVRSKREAERAKETADQEIVSGFQILDPELKRLHNVCKAHCVVGEELERADGQPIRRIVKPPKKRTDARVRKDPTEDLTPSDQSDGICTEQRPKSGRKVKWDVDRPDEDSFIRRTVEEVGELPDRGGEPHPKAIDLLLTMMERLRVSAATLAEALRSNPHVSSGNGETGAVAD